MAWYEKTRPAVAFSADDRRRMVEFCQHLRPHLERLSEGERYEAGLMAFGLMNLACDLIQMYPPAFRKELLAVAEQFIFQMERPRKSDGPRLISLH